MKTTGWFPVSCDPVHIGFYDLSFPSGFETRAHWDGYLWCMALTDLHFKGGAPMLDMRKLKWRGLTQPAGETP